MNLAQRLLRDTSGGAITDMLSFTPTWFVLFGVFLMNVQLGRNYEQRDMVDHAAALAADTTMKTICDNNNGSPIGALTGPSMGAVNTSIQPLLQMVSGASNPCQVQAIPSGDGGGVSGAREVDVEVTCRFPCTVPLASQLMCTDGYVTLSAKHKTVAMGCDAS
jgi:hypothetical protein